MKIHKLMAIVWVFCYTFMTTITTFAESDPSPEMMEKQKEVDQIIFEDKKTELADKGITVTHTVPLENSVEIGVQPYSDETVNYLYELLRKDNVTIVNGQQAFTLNGTEEKLNVSTELPPSKKSSSTFNFVYVSAAVILIGGGIAAVFLRKKLLNGVKN